MTVELIHPYDATNNAIVTAIGSTAAPLSEVIDSVSRQLAVSRASVKVAIWQLYADGDVSLTPEWDLVNHYN